MVGWIWDAISACCPSCSSLHCLPPVSHGLRCTPLAPPQRHAHRVASERNRRGR
jgi:hypothetical protein